MGSGLSRGYVSCVFLCDFQSVRIQQTPPATTVISRELCMWVWDFASSAHRKTKITKSKHTVSNVNHPFRNHALSLPVQNYHAQKLHPREAQLIREDAACKSRVLRSYKLFLDFLGIALQVSVYHGGTLGHLGDMQFETQSLIVSIFTIFFLLHWIYVWVEI